MTNSEWYDLICKEFGVCRNTARCMLHGMYAAFFGEKERKALYEEMAGRSKDSNRPLQK